MPISWTVFSAAMQIHMFFSVDFRFLVLRYHGRLDMVKELLAAGASKAGRPRFAGGQRVFSTVRMKLVVHLKCLRLHFVLIGVDLSSWLGRVINFVMGLRTKV